MIIQRWILKSLTPLHLKKNSNVSGHQSLTFNELSSLQCSSSGDSEVSVSTRVLIPICTQLNTNTYHSEELTGPISSHISECSTVLDYTPSAEGIKLNETGPISSHNISECSIVFNYTPLLKAAN